MTTTQDLIGVGLSGMNAAKALMAIASKNATNATTPGYARQRLGLQAQPWPGVAVLPGQVRSVRAVLLQQALHLHLGAQGQAQAKVEVLSLAEAALDPLADVGLAEALDGFSSALKELAASPSDPALRQAVVDAANHLTGQFHAAAAQLQAAADLALGKAQGDIDKANGLIAKVAALNGQIQAAQGTDAVADLVTQRDEVLSELSGLLDVQVSQQADGTTSVFALGGMALVDGAQAAKLVLEPSKPSAGGPASVALVHPDGHKVAAVAHAGGAIGGDLSAYRDSVLPAMQTLDELAYALGKAFNQAHEAGYGADNSTGVDFFALPADKVGAASAIAVDPAVALDPNKIAASKQASAPGANDNLQALVSVLDDAPLVGGQTASQVVEATAEALASDLASAQAAADVEDAAVSQTQGLIDAVQGVNVDEEMVALTRAQDALAASAAVIRATKEMTDTVLGLVRR